MTETPLQIASQLKVATRTELDAAILTFEAAVFRQDSRRLAEATTAAHAAVQEHLDAIASIWAIAKRDWK